MSFTIVTDSTSNLTPKIIAEHGVVVIPFPCIAGEDKAFCPDIDSFDEVKFYDAMKAGMSVSTSQINPKLYENYFEPILKRGEDILFVGLSSGVSSSYSSATVARQTLSERYPDRCIEVVDSRGASLGEGLVTIRAIRCRDGGMGISETAEHLRTMRKRIAQLFFVDDLMFLRKTGRLSGGVALIGTMLGIKPLLKGDEDGKIVGFEKVRGRKQAIIRLAERYASLAKDAANQIVGISHCGCAKDADWLASLVREKLPPREILIVKHEPSTGSHLGPGSLAIYFEGDDLIRSI